MLIVWGLFLALITSIQGHITSSVCEYSFFYLTYRQPLAARLLFLRVREFYPTAPIYILTDKGGVDLSGFCKEDSNPSFCQAHINEIHNGHAFQSYNEPLKNSTLYALENFFGHMSQAAQFGRTFGCEYMIMIEEDIWLQRPFTALDRPKGDTGGVYNKWYPVFITAIQTYFEEMTGLESMPIQGVIYGGSYYKASSLIDAVSKFHHVNWQHLSELDGRVPMAWDTAPPFLFGLTGHTDQQYWAAICERPNAFERRFSLNCSNATMLHKQHRDMTTENKAYRAYLRHSQGEKELLQRIIDGQQSILLSALEVEQLLIKYKFNKNDV